MEVGKDSLCSDCTKCALAEMHAVLKDPLLIDKIKAECGKKIVGEDNAVHTVLLCAFGRLVENAELTSYNLFVNSNSGAGKDFVTRNVLSILPPGIVESRTRISPTAFNYWHNSEDEPEWTWDGKVCYLEDVSTNVLNSEVFKTMSSSGSKVTITVENAAKEIEIVGKPVIIVTAASVTLAREMLRRFTSINLDETREQTQAIKRMQSEQAKTGKKLAYDDNIKHSLSSLKRVKVRIPYADLLDKYFPDEHLILRTHYSRFLDYIKASAALYQEQREKDDDGFVLAAGRDYENARLAIEATSSSKNMVPLSIKEQEILKSLLDIQGDSLKMCTIDEVVQTSKMPRKFIYLHLEKLTEYGIVTRDVVEDRLGAGRPASVYRANIITGGLKLPSFDDVLASMGNEISANGPPASDKADAA